MHKTRTELGVGGPRASQDHGTEDYEVLQDPVMSKVTMIFRRKAQLDSQINVYVFLATWLG